MSSIVLIGFMGAGKTTVGKELVKKGFELIDTDAYIEGSSSFKDNTGGSPREDRSSAGRDKSTQDAACTR